MGAGNVPWGEAFLAMLAMLIVLVFVLIYYCVMPVLTAMKRRKEQEEESWERDPRWNGDKFRYMPKLPDNFSTDKKYSRLAACSRSSRYVKSKTLRCWRIWWMCKNNDFSKKGQFSWPLTILLPRQLFRRYVVSSRDACNLAKVENLLCASWHLKIHLRTWLSTRLIFWRLGYSEISAINCKKNMDNLYNISCN